MSDAVQGSAEWLAERAGKLTASRFKDVIAIGRGGKPLEARNKYMRELAFERMSGTAKHSVSSQAMAWGTDVEQYAREAYELKTGNFVTEVGFVLHPEYDFIGASSDGVVDDDGLIEIKSPFDEAVHIGTWLEGMPESHMAQVQGNMIVTGRRWCDFCSYDPRQSDRYRLYVQRIERDEGYIADLLKQLLAFNDELCEMVDRIRSKAA